MWSTHNIIVTGTPVLIRVEKAFTKDETYFINLDSTCEAGSDEYLNKEHLFELESDAIIHGLNILKTRKIDLMRKYNEADYLYSSLLDKLLHKITA